MGSYIYLLKLESDHGTWNISKYSCFTWNTVSQASTKNGLDKVCFSKALVTGSSFNVYLSLYLICFMDELLKLPVPDFQHSSSFM